MYLSLIFVFIIGAAMGSFINVLALRADRLDSVLTGRSECPACHHQLGWRDLVPIISYLMLRGRCHYCGKKISWEYPMVEAVVGLVFALLYWAYGFQLSYFFYAVVFSILGVVFLHDARTQLVPEEFVWVALVIAVLGSAYFGSMSWQMMMLGGLVAGGLPALLVVISREQWMGAGDIKISFILGALLGYPRAVLGIFTAFLLGSIFGIIYIYFGRKTMKDSLAFGPFLISAAYLMIVFGNYILIRYADWFSFLI